VLLAKRKDDDDEEQEGAGMADAFRQLDALTGSLDDDGDKNKPTPSKKIPKPSAVDLDGDNKGEITPEKELKAYKDMVKDLETKEEDDLYSDVLSDMGGSAETTPKAAPQKKKSPRPSSSDRQKFVSVEESSSSPTTSRDAENEEFMNRALKEALEDVKVRNPSISESILDDKEIMKEIEVRVPYATVLQL